ncbi:polysaccharide deacetylase family protein [Streptacidiphilus monticola]|uniref:Polysaccharide deacetylase family protein n=1 Tax=Streptacidiphilus monticola TaxID=2161674 RepID=A0ABW1G8R8_9ACTN
MHPAPTGRVVLTFDDGPHPDSTPKLLDLLAAAEAPAVFFLCGEPAERHPELVRSIQAAGHRLGNHSRTHPYLTRLQDDEVRAELTATQAGVAEATGSAPTLFRPPYLDTDARIAALAGEFGLTEVGCTLDTRDWAGLPAEDIAAAADRAADGDVILLHDNPALHTLPALPELLRRLAERGLTPSLEELWTRG